MLLENALDSNDFSIQLNHVYKVKNKSSSVLKPAVNDALLTDLIGKVAEKKDKLDQTVDYVELSDIVALEMNIPSKLIEHVANRVLNAVLNRWKKIKVATITIKKLNPPMNEYVESVDYTISLNQSTFK